MLKLQETQLLEHCKLKPRPQIQALVDIGKSDQCSWNAKQHGSMYDLFTTWFHEFRIINYFVIGSKIVLLLLFLPKQFDI